MKRSIKAENWPFEKEKKKTLTKTRIKNIEKKTIKVDSCLTGILDSKEENGKLRDVKKKVKEVALREQTGSSESNLRLF